MDETRKYKFIDLDLSAKRIAIKEFVFDIEVFSPETKPPNTVEAYHLLLDNNDENFYDEDGVLVSNGGMYQ